MAAKTINKNFYFQKNHWTITERCFGNSLAINNVIRGRIAIFASTSETLWKEK